MPRFLSSPTRFLFILASALAGNALVGQASAQIPCQYTVAATIQAPSGPFGLPSPTIGTAISPNGRYVVGYFNPGGIGSDRAFAYDMQTQTFHVIPLPPGGLSSYANDVNDAGLAVGTNGLVTGFIYSIPKQQYLHTLTSDVPNGNCVITGINSNNVVCGWRSITGSPTWLRTAFRWSATTGMQELGLIDGDSSSATGIAEDGRIAVARSVGTSAHVWTRSSLTTVGLPPGVAYMTPNAIGEQSRVLGATTISIGMSSYSRPFQSMAGQFQPMPILAVEGASCTPLDVNSNGVAVGAYSITAAPAQPNWRACAWYCDQTVDLNSRLVAGGGVVLGVGSAVANTRRVVCWTVAVTFVIDPLPNMPGDTNCDALVNVTDLLAVIGHWGERESFADANFDGIVNALDLYLVILHWG